MPKYLGIDYLADALVQRRDSLSKLLLTIPTHLETIEKYTHCGKAAKKYGSPWKKETHYKLSNKQPVDYLSQITSSLQRLEPFSPRRIEEEFIPSSNPDSPLVSFDLWSDLEEEVTNYVIQSLAPDKEQFTPIIGSAQETGVFVIHVQEAENTLEEVECIPHLRNKCQKIPLANELTSRLKTKLIADPLLLDSKGNPLDENSILRMDRRFICSEGSEKFPDNGEESFTKYLNYEIENDSSAQANMIEVTSSPVVSPVNTVCVEEVKEKLRKMENSINAQLKEKPLAEVLCQQSMVNEVESFGGGTPPNADCSFSEKQRTQNGMNFVSLNNEDDLCQRSQAEKQQLESPFNPPSSSEKNIAEKFMTTLRTMDMSPEGNSPQLTPSDQCIQNIWENEKILFSEHLATTLSVPNLSTRKRARLITAYSAIKKLRLSEDSVDGNLELNLPWDPLSMSVKVIESSQKSLNKPEIWNGRTNDDNYQAAAGSKELFQKFSIHTQGQDLSGTTSLQLGIQSAVRPEFFKAHGSPEYDDRYDLSDSWDKSFEAPSSCVSTSSTDVQNSTSIENGSSLRPQNQDKTFQIHHIAPAIHQKSSGGLEDFILLRKGQVDSCKVSSQMTSPTPPKKIGKAAKIRPSVIVTEEDVKRESPNHEKAVTESVQPVERRVISIELSEEYKEIVEELISYIKPLLIRLQESGVIARSKALSNLNLDFTRFVLKQAEVTAEKDKEDSTKRKFYCMAVCLHSLVCCVDVLMQSGLEAAIAHFRAIQEKYSHLLGGALEASRRHLFRAHFEFQRGRILHPKMCRLLTIVGRWATGSSREQTENKSALVIVYTYPEKLSEEILGSLAALKDVQVKADWSLDDVISKEAKSKLSVFVVSATAIVEDFPWKSFDYVLEYDHNSKVSLQMDTTCYNSKRLKEHISLMVVTKGLPQLSPTQTEACLNPALQNSAEKHYEQFIFIGSEKLTENIDLLHLLESQYNVLIYERRYQSLNIRDNDACSKMCLQPDLMVDERTCVYLQNHALLASETEYEYLRDIVTSLSLKSHKCYIILTCTAPHTNLAFPEDVFRHLSMLFANIAHFDKSEFDVEILYSSVAEDTARLVRQIGDFTRANSVVWDKQEWTRRQWLTNEASAHEVFLVSFPCMNSFSAQVMLTAAPLTVLLNLSLEELKETCPWISQRTLTEFYKTVNWCSDLNENLPVHVNLRSRRFAQGWHQICPSDMVTEERNLQRPNSNLVFEPTINNVNYSMSNLSDWLGTRGTGIESEEVERSRIFSDSTQRRNNQRRAKTEGFVPKYHMHSTTHSSAFTSPPYVNAFGDYPDPNTRDQLLQRRDQPCQFLYDERLKRSKGNIRNPARTAIDEDWKVPPLQRNLKEQRIVQADKDLTGCFAGSEFATHGDCQHSQSQRAKEYFDPSYDISNSWRMRPKYIEQARKEDSSSDTLATSCDDRIFQPSKYAIGLGESASQPPEPDAMEEFLPKGFWNTQHFPKNDCGDSYHPRLLGDRHPRASQQVPVDPPRNRARQAVRVLDLGNDDPHTSQWPAKVGIAQPQRRVYGPTVHQPTWHSRSSHVLSKNSVASDNKRFSLGIAKCTNTAAKEQLKISSKGEHEVPGYRPSPEDMEEVSIFAKNLSSTKRRKLSYEKIPGAEGGQTKLVFKYDF